MSVISLCVVIIEDQRGPDGVGYIPSVVQEGVAGHYPLRGGEGGRPWVWGPSLEEAKAQAYEYNATMGLTPNRVMEIIRSSFGVQE